MLEPRQCVPKRSTAGSRDLPAHLDKQMREIKDKSMLDKLHVWPKTPTCFDSTQSTRMKYILHSNGQELSIDRYLSPKSVVNSVTKLANGKKNVNKKRHCLVASGPGLSQPVLIYQSSRHQKDKGFECRIWLGTGLGFSVGPAEIRRVAVDDGTQPAQTPKTTRPGMKRERSEDSDYHHDENFRSPPPNQRRAPLRLKSPNQGLQFASSDLVISEETQKTRVQSDTKKQPRTLGTATDESDIGSKEEEQRFKQPFPERSSVKYPTPSTTRPSVSRQESSARDIRTYGTNNPNIIVNFIDKDDTIVRTRPFAECSSVGKFFEQAMAAFRSHRDENWILLVSEAGGEQFPLVKGDQQDFNEITESLKTEMKVKLEGGGEGFAVNAVGGCVIEARYQGL